MTSTEPKPTSSLDIEFTLPTNVKKILAMKDSYVVESDMDYYYLLKAIVESKRLAPIYSNNLSFQMCISSHGQLEFSRDFIATAAKIPNELETLRENVMKKTDFVPIFERLMLDMEATPIERSIFEYWCLLYQVSAPKNDRTDDHLMRRKIIGADVAKLSSVLGCEVEDILQFASPTSKWRKAKILSDSITSPKEPMPPLTFGCEEILMGLPLTSKQLLTIESDFIRKYSIGPTLKADELESKTTKSKRSPEESALDDEGSSSNLKKRAKSFAVSTLDLTSVSDVHSLFNILKQNETYSSNRDTDLKKTDSIAGSGGSIEEVRVVDPFLMGPNLRAPKEALNLPPIASPNLHMKENDDEFKKEGVEVNNGELFEEQEGKQGRQQQAPLSLQADKESVDFDEEITAYKNDLAYIQDQIDLSNCLMSIANNMQTKESFRNVGDDSDDDMQNGLNDHDEYESLGRFGLGRRGKINHKSLKTSNETQLKRLRVKERVLRGKINERLNLTLEGRGWYPRLERLVEVLKLSAFEKHVIVSLIRTVIAPSPTRKRSYMYMEGGGRKMVLSIGTLLDSFCSNLEEKITFRKYFYKDSRLVRDGILNMVGQDFMVDLSECTVEIDRRMLDFCLGLDTEISEVVDGSHLYTPEVDIEDVILPEDTKQLLIEAVGNFDRVKQVEKELEIDKKITYGRGMVLLFHGASGTGKTMLANGVAAKMKRKILLINFPSLGGNSAGQIIKLIFREAKIHNAVVFFDECESLFMSRMKGSNNVNMLLTELERHDGLSILATNRASDLDEAMYRRITLSVEFRKPDHILREQIWKTLQPPKLRVDKDINLMELALKYELTGGFIKNAWLSALSFAVSRDSQNPTVTQQDLAKAASHQLRGRLSSVDFDRRIVPTRGLDMVILDKEVKSALQDMVNFGKSEAILFGQWGFSSQHGGSKGVSALFHGHPGTGKTMAAEAIGYDLGRPLKVVNCAQLLSKWVGESAKNIQAVFDEAKAVDAVLVFDEAESLFGSREGDGGSDGAGRHDTGNVGILLHHIETSPGVVIVITNLKDRIDTAFFRRFKFVVEFPKPSTSERLDMWKLMIPNEAPLSKDVDLSVLANRYTGFTGGNIKTAVFRAASRAALRASPSDRMISMEDLLKSCEEETGKSVSTKQASTLSMYS